MMDRIFETIDRASVSLPADVLIGLVAGLRGTLSFPTALRAQ
jgi:hypothetical protein